MTYWIMPLDEKPEMVETCAAWAYTEWGCQQTGPDLRSTAKSYKIKARHKKKIPRCWVAVHQQGYPAGMASFVADDHPDHPELYPWLASVFVHSEHRGQGLSKKLVYAVEDHAVYLGYPRIYLFTHTASELYQKLGYRPEGNVRDITGLRAIPDILMSKEL